MSTWAYGASITATITGDTIKWNDANFFDGQLAQVVWQSASKHNLQPVKEWRPALTRSLDKKLIFHSLDSNNPGSVEVSFQHTGIEFKGNYFTSPDFSSNLGQSYTPCAKQYSNGDGGYTSLVDESNDKCVSSYAYSATERARPFDFYRSMFKIDNDELINSFKGVGAGTYYSNITFPITYLARFGVAQSYRTFTENVTFIVKYKPSYISSIDIKGDGVFNLDYDTQNHSVSGNSNFKIDVTGFFNSGLLLSFKSDGINDDFYLTRRTRDEGSDIPYNLGCDKCETTTIIKDGKLTKLEPIRISSPQSKRIDFELNFYFENLLYGSIEEGRYVDSIIVMFEPDL